MSMSLSRGRSRLLVVGGLLLATATTAGCRDGQYLGRRDTVTFAAGDAIAHNKAIHTVDPWPHYAKDTRHRTDGKRMMIGIGRYQANQSIEPQGLATNDRFEDTSGGGPPAPPVDGNGSASN
ncbi:MAG: hypothetical protein MI824_16340 [Hyphomicrobiales bacterium]|nr:hypothetical protein [Hyphomicrobiales bacterium]